jgi:hypothetical protein
MKDLMEQGRLKTVTFRVLEVALLIEGDPVRARARSSALEPHVTLFVQEQFGLFTTSYGGGVLGLLKFCVLLACQAIAGGLCGSRTRITDLLGVVT